MRLCFGSYLAILVPCKAVNIDNKQLCSIFILLPPVSLHFQGRECRSYPEDATSKLLRCEQNLSKDITGPARSAVLEYSLRTMSSSCWTLIYQADNPDT